MGENEQKEMNKNLMKALAAGAATAFRPNLLEGSEAQKKIAAAYLELKDMIQKRFRQVDVTLLDIGPGSEERQEALAKQIDEAGVAEDDDILKQAQIVLEIITQEEPEALWAAEPADPAPQHE